MRSKPRSHLSLAQLADEQHGVVGRRQLRALGYSDSAITRACATGRLHRIHRGTYAVGVSHISNQGHALAAVLAMGPRALLSHASAAWLWGLSSKWALPVHVTVPGRGSARKEIRAHHAPALVDADRSEREGIPATAVPRTLLDLAGSVSTEELTRAVERAEKLEIFDLTAIDHLLARVTGHSGRNRLRRAIAGYRDLPFTRSELERQFFELVDRAGLPRPRVNAFVDGYELDMYWPRHRFAIELDGYEHHRSRAAFERDRVRLEELKILGIEVIRITARRVAAEPGAVMRSIGMLLKQRELELAPIRPPKGARTTR